jgi:drug/metabolite transporter (DMT)-like permease
VAIIISFATQGHLQEVSLSATQWRNLILIVFSTGAVALFIYYYGLNHLPASHATLYELAWPLSAMILDWFVRGQTLSPAQILGAILLLGSMILLSRENSNV